MLNLRKGSFYKLSQNLGPNETLYGCKHSPHLSILRHKLSAQYMLAIVGIIVITIVFVMIIIMMMVKSPPPPPSSHGSHSTSLMLHENTSE